MFILESETEQCHHAERELAAGGGGGGGQLRVPHRHHVDPHPSHTRRRASGPFMAVHASPTLLFSDSLAFSLCMAVHLNFPSLPHFLSSLFNFFPKK